MSSSKQRIDNKTKKKVLALISKGKSSKEIAIKVAGISMRSVAALKAHETRGTYA